MRILPTWQLQNPDKDSLKSIVYDVAYSPDGNYLAAACGARVLVFNAGSGEQLHALKGHKDQVRGRTARNFEPLFSNQFECPAGALRVVEQRRRVLRFGRRR